VGLLRGAVDLDVGHGSVLGQPFGLFVVQREVASQQGNGGRSRVQGNEPRFEEGRVRRPCSATSTTGVFQQLPHEAVVPS
jgi:hypothetical protein